MESKLVPVMREAILTVQMVAYKMLAENLSRRRRKLSEREQRLLAGAVINNLFATESAHKEVGAFYSANRAMVEEELHTLAENLQELSPYLTDALRMKTICDNQEGVHSIGSLLMAKALHILQEERPLPMPSTFMLSVRSLAVQHGLVERN